MALSDLTSSQLQQLIELITEKERLLKRLAEVDLALMALEDGNGEKAPTSPLKRRKRRGTLKVKILAALRSAGKKGLSVQELATMLKAKVGSVAVWFYTTGKKTKGIEKIAPSRYSYTGE
jgi:hypothetical protein